MFDQPPGNGVFVLFELSGHLKLTVVIWATASSSSFGKDVTEQVTTCSGVLQLIVVTLQQQSVSCSKRREKVSQRLIYLWAPYSKYKAGHSGGAHGETRRALERVAFTDTPDTISKSHKVVRRYSRGKRECSSLYFIYYIAPLLGKKKELCHFPSRLIWIKPQWGISFQGDWMGFTYTTTPVLSSSSSSCTVVCPWSFCQAYLVLTLPASPLPQFSSILLPLSLSAKMFFMPWNPFFLANVSPEDSLCSYEMDTTVTPDFMGQEEGNTIEQVFASCSKLNL